MNLNHKHLNIVSAIGSIFLLCVMTLCIYWLFFEPQIIEIKNSKAVQVDKAAYHPGEPIKYTLDYCKYRDQSATVHRTLIDTVKIQYADFQSTLPLGCRTVTVIDLIAPNFLKPSGEVYHIEGLVEYQINPLKKQYVHWKSVGFIIN